MSLTVKTCMGLPAFRYAKIVAGKGGINQTVNSITVLEYSDVDVISSDLFLNHEMCITAFSSIKDDVDKQCAIVRRMKEIGICAVVLYYIGIFVPYLDDKLISTADEVNLPLICIDEQESISHEQVLQAAELISLFMNISSYSLEETSPEMIIRSIITNEQMQIRELSAKHGIDVAKIQRMWLLGGGSMGDFKQKRQLKQCVSQIRSFFRNRGKWALVDLYQNSIIVLFQAAAFSELDETMEEELMKDLLDEGLHLALTKCMSITSIQNIQNMYELYEAYFDTVRMIYPTRSTFDLYDLSFAEKIKKLADDGYKVARHMYSLQPIRQEANYSILLETLAAYLLDAGENLQRTAEVLGVHKNTVRYRLNQIRASYACEISQMPLVAELYEAVALQRLLSNN